MGTDQKIQRVASFETHPSNYRHWKLTIDGAVASLVLDIAEENGLRPHDYVLKLNSYDLGVDIELQDAVDRLRFEHPEVRAVAITSGQPKVFCAGANIRMLASSTHAFKVNFCRYTNETRCHIEDSDQTYVAALNGTASGGGYELALACDQIWLIDDGSSAVSLPEVPLLGVLPGTGGLTRLVDKRKVRRDLADLFCTKAEGFRLRDAKRANLVDGGFPRSRWDQGMADVMGKLAAANPARSARGITLAPLQVETDGPNRTYSAVSLTVSDDGRVATLTVKAPTDAPPASAAALHDQGAAAWSLRVWRELEDAIFHLRFNLDTVGLVLLKTEGDAAAVLAHDRVLLDHRDTWIASEILAFQARVLRRLDNTAKTLFALVDAGSCFAGSLLELAFAADRAYMLDDGDVTVQVTEMSAGVHRMSTGLSRLQARFVGTPDQVDVVLATKEPVAGGDAMELGLVTMAPDEIDWDDEIRIAIEERVSLSPDALTGMEQNLRFVGAETCDTKIFGRLSAWQNWIFQRPNAVGDHGALTLYGHPERPRFDWQRT